MKRGKYRNNGDGKEKGKTCYEELERKKSNHI
jgi:hypothetical protein